MSTQGSKSGPAGIPTSPVRLEDVLRRAADGEPVGPDVRIGLDVEGGHRDERYEFHFLASGAGEAEAELHDNLAGRQVPRKMASLEPSEFADLVRRVELQPLIRASLAKQQIPPGSVVGRLEVRGAGHDVRAIFMADPGQAESAGYEMPAGITDVVERIYDIAADKLGVDDVRPWTPDERGGKGPTWRG
jgi:hypothetical protein